MGQELGLDYQPGVVPLSDRFAEMGGIPVNDDGGEEVEAGHAVVLALARAVADFALTPDAERVLEGVMSLALVQAGVGPALHIGVELPVDDEERSFDPSDFSESDGQFVLARIGRELSQQLTRRKDPAGQGGSNPQDIRPVAHDHVLPDFVSGQSDQGFRNASGLEDMQPFRRQVPDARDEAIAEQGCGGEDVVGETAGVGVLLADAPPSPGHQQPVEDIGRLVDRGRDCLRCEGSEPVRDMGIGLEAWLAPIAGVDEVHRFALACGREELPVAGGGKAQAPEAGPGQLRLRLDHRGQGPVYRLAFDLPAREAGELEEVMGVGGLGILLRPRLRPSARRTFRSPILSLHGAPVRRYVKASVKPVAASTSSRIWVIRTSGRRLYRSSTSSSTSSGIAVAGRAILNSPSSMVPPGILPWCAASARRSRPSTRRTLCSANHSRGSIRRAHCSDHPGRRRALKTLAVSMQGNEDSNSTIEPGAFAGMSSLETLQTNWPINRSNQQRRPTLPPLDPIPTLKLLTITTRGWIFNPQASFLRDLPNLKTLGIRGEDYSETAPRWFRLETNLFENSPELEVVGISLDTSNTQIAIARDTLIQLHGLKEISLSPYSTSEISLSPNSPLMKDILNDRKSPNSYTLIPPGATSP